MNQFFRLTLGIFVLNQIIIPSYGNVITKIFTKDTLVEKFKEYALEIPSKKIRRLIGMRKHLQKREDETFAKSMNVERAIRTSAYDLVRGTYYAIFDQELRGVREQAYDTTMMIRNSENQNMEPVKLDLNKLKSQLELKVVGPAFNVDYKNWNRNFRYKRLVRKKARVTAMNDRHNKEELSSFFEEHFFEKLRRDIEDPSNQSLTKDQVAQDFRELLDNGEIFRRFREILGANWEDGPIYKENMDEEEGYETFKRLLKLANLKNLFVDFLDLSCSEISVRPYIDAEKIKIMREKNLINWKIELACEQRDREGFPTRETKYLLRCSSLIDTTAQKKYLECLKEDLEANPNKNVLSKTPNKTLHDKIVNLIKKTDLDKW